MLSAKLLKACFNLGDQQMKQARKDGLKLSDYKSGDRSLSHVDGFRHVLHANLMDTFPDPLSLKSVAAVGVVNALFADIEKMVPVWRKQQEIGADIHKLSPCFAVFSTKPRGHDWKLEPLLFSNVFDLAKAFDRKNGPQISSSLVLNLTLEYNYYGFETNGESIGCAIDV